eukprot:TRINITY_DN1123_c0_g1_i15.p2 TRINITY_DN1123_c0_g1~~TRINITY_DN1123_c0_g1_i15.p2  ORF type:complete len:307 (+),score=94.62 TRINITY_DN1123_c0_g1_i15:260-1180(+)
MFWSTDSSIAEVMAFTLGRRLVLSLLLVLVVLVLSFSLLFLAVWTTSSAVVVVAVAAPRVRITVVYYTALNPAKWRDLVGMQLWTLVECGLAAAADSVEVVFSSLGDDAAGRQQLAEAAEFAELLLGGVAALRVATHPGNHYEYPGIRRAFDLAAEGELRGESEDEQRRHLVLYHHGKGMFSTKGDQTKGGALLTVTPVVVEGWRGIVQRFANDSAMNKAGYITSPAGFHWYNFWWARASYLRLLEPPQVHDEDRFYYERWLGGLYNPTTGQVQNAGATDALSLCAGNRGRVLNYACPNTKIRWRC